MNKTSSGFSDLFCPKCGKTQGTFVQGFCLDCYTQDHPLVETPSELLIEYCQFCNKVKLQGKWLAQSHERLTDFVLKQIKPKELLQVQVSLQLEPLEEGQVLAHVIISGVLHKEPLTFSKDILLMPRKSVCEACNKQKGGYFEATLQIRWIHPEQRKVLEPKLIREIRDYLKGVHEKEALAFIAKQTETDYGIDFVLGSKKAAKKTAEYLAKLHDSTVTTSFRLHSKRKNVELKRLTYCVRV